MEEPLVSIMENLCFGFFISNHLHVYFAYFSNHLHVLFSLVKTAREEAASYRQQFKRPIPLKVLNDRLSNFIHAYTLYSAVRPFGVSCILASNDPHTGPEMYMIEPSGTSYVRIQIRML